MKLWRSLFFKDFLLMINVIVFRQFPLCKKSVYIFCFWRFLIFVYDKSLIFIATLLQTTTGISILISNSNRMKLIVLWPFIGSIMQFFSINLVCSIQSFMKIQWIINLNDSLLGSKTCLQTPHKKVWNQRCKYKGTSFHNFNSFSWGWIMDAVRGQKQWWKTQQKGVLSFSYWFCLMSFYHEGQTLSRQRKMQIFLEIKILVLTFSSSLQKHFLESIIIFQTMIW